MSRDKSRSKYCKMRLMKNLIFRLGPDQPDTKSDTSSIKESSEYLLRLIALQLRHLRMNELCVCNSAKLINKSRQLMLTNWVFASSLMILYNLFLHQSTFWYKAILLHSSHTINTVLLLLPLYRFRSLQTFCALFTNI